MTFKKKANCIARHKSGRNLFKYPKIMKGVDEIRVCANKLDEIVPYMVYSCLTKALFYIYLKLIHKQHKTYKKNL